MGIKVDLSVGIDMTEINFSNFLYGTPDKHTPSQYVLKYSGGYSDVFSGHGFKYNNKDVPTSGTVESLTEYHGHKQLFSISHGDMSAKAIVNAAYTKSLNDDANLILKAMRGDDDIQGSNGNDVLFGAGGDDKIDGNGGRDVLLSGPGADIMRGGTGNDIFYFIAEFHSGTTRKTMDTIVDFRHGDKIDLSNLDLYDFIGTASFSGSGGEVRFENRGGDTFVYGDYDGNGQADFAIHLLTNVTMTDRDFTF